MTDERSRAESWRPQQFFAHRLQSAREFASLNDDGGLAVDFYPVSRVPPQLRVEGGQSRSMSLWLTQSDTGFLTIPTLEADLFTIRFVTGGQMVRRNWQGEHVVAQGFATISALEDMRNGEASPRFSALSCTIARVSLLAGYHALEGQPDRPLPLLAPVVPIEGLGMRSLLLTLKQMHLRLQSIRAADDLFFPLIEEIITYKILSVWPRVPVAQMPSAAASSAEHARRAIAYIEARLAEPLRLADVASAAGVSVRMLQLSFKRELGVTPIEFIIGRRLQKVHDDIGNAAHRDTSLAELSRRWGFVHISDFTQRYRRRFGCTPGETRRRTLREVDH